METYYKELARLEKWKRELHELELILKIVQTQHPSYSSEDTSIRAKFWKENAHKMNNLKQKIYNYENIYLVNTYTDFILESYSKNYKEDFKVEF